jgi:hypothetical protein
MTGHTYDNLFSIVAAITAAGRPPADVATGNDADDAFGAELDRAVMSSLRVTSDVGVMVSGGVYSAVVTAIAGRRSAAGRCRRSTGCRRGTTRITAPSASSTKARMCGGSSHLPHVDFKFVPPVTGHQISLASYASLGPAADQTAL